MKKKVISLLLSMIMIMSCLPIAASAASQQEGANWAKAQVGKAIDFDGVYGAQCVDLTKAYCYNFFKWAPKGNACDYRTLTLPSLSWKRGTKASWGTPQPGDIVIYTPGYAGLVSSYGHVGIVYSANASNYVCIEQNYNGIMKVTQNTRKNYNDVWGYIRPPFSSSTNVNITFKNISASDIGTNSVKVYAEAINPDKVAITKVGVNIWNQSGTLIKNYYENVASSVQKLSLLQFWFESKNELKDVNFQPNSKYTYQMKVTASGKEFLADKKSFTTKPSTSEPAPPPDPTPPTSSTPFTDINMWAKDSIEWSYNKNLFSGTSTTRFSPNAPMNRAMLATVLWRLDGKPAAGGNSSFVDVPSGQYYSEAIKWASDNNIVSGTGNGRFSPDKYITREQLSTMLYRYAQYKGKANGSTSLAKYLDANNVSIWAYEAMQWAVGNGIVTGKQNVYLAPKDNSTRAEVATMLKRFAE